LKVNSNSILSWTAIAAISFFLLREIGYSIWNKINIGKLSYSIDRSDTKKIDLTIQMPLINTSNVSVPVEGFKGVLKYGSNIISNLVIPSPFTIIANQNISVPIKATVYYGDLALNIVDVFRSKKLKLPLVVNGIVKIKGGINIRVNERLEWL